MTTIIIENNGPDIKSTTYWSSEHAKKGLFYLSWNASVARVLVPDRQVVTLSEMKTGKVCVISRGVLCKTEALELMWDDGSDSPFALHIDLAQSDRRLLNDGKPFVVAAWTRRGKAGEWPGHYRVVDSLPCMKSIG